MIDEQFNESDEITEILNKITKIDEEITYLKDLFQRRLISDKQSDKLINSVSEHLNSRLQLDKGQNLIDIFKEILHVVDFLESDEYNQINLNLAEQIITIFQRRNFEIIDIDNLDNPIYYEVSEVEDSINVNKPEIAEVISKGYALDGKVIRPAKVKMYKPILE
ncbi:nucleotide exchange factor GrpE [uncultured Parvimonas sp.]|uniref:nucleotide exchange factor GrpE n=1 Tax=uncultured Parvimonas sp. TaxID=747372 RepID=UPI0028057873|nr:nucleotide exchange factor GrpE [uncultured Parvimonas sp.]